ncbi:MAG: galactose mutarotase [Croceitalea sp.]|nr:galactose mutarotase [Croceitalea sp.]
MTNALTIKKTPFGRMPNNDRVDRYTLTNQNGMEVSILNYGGIITSLKVPNKNGTSENVVLGFNTLNEYIKHSPYFGAIIGRFCNRIANGTFQLDGKHYFLNTNNGENHLHGGLKGFDKVVWEATTKVDEASASLILTYMSPHMEEGYPGNLMTTVTYRLTNKNALEVHYQATTDKPTVINLTQHSYFNLSGDFTNTILDHHVQIQADEFLPIYDELIPIGNLATVSNTPFDFRDFTSIRNAIDSQHEQLQRGSGYDHCWVIRKSDGSQQLIASVIEPVSGRKIDVLSDQPGVQFYTGNGLDGDFLPRTAFCLETQHFPDSPNKIHFPSTVLKPKEVFESTTVFDFSII